jgi:predicted N-acyltransferase
MLDSHRQGCLNVPSPPHELRIVERIADIEAAQWDRLSGGGASISHAFLSALESAACVGAGTGWHAHHLTLWRDAELVAAIPLYEKHHSYGEYVFDWAWADAFARNGLDYYPKLLSAVPFTPIPGSRLLGLDDAARRALLEAALSIADASGCSSIHFLFPTEIETSWLREAGLLIRQGVQFHWCNAGYSDMDDFLSRLNHEKRKKIRQERRRAQAHGLHCEWLDGEQASEADWQFFHQCYTNTYALHRSTPYLSLAFFSTLASQSPHSVRLLVARRGDTAVASAFFLCDDDALYGRYWGASEYLPFLHFELCYYQAIEYCIDNDLKRFEGGAQGEHKLSRGLEPVVTRSAHWIRDPRFRDAVDRFLAQESEGIGFYLDELSDRSPFRRAHQNEALPSPQPSQA